MGVEPTAKAPSGPHLLGTVLGGQAQGPAGPGPFPFLEAPPPRRDCPVPDGPRERHSRWGALTGLQGGQGFRLLTELAVPNIIGCFHSEFVGCEGLEPVGGNRFNEWRYPPSGLAPPPLLREWGRRADPLNRKEHQGSERRAGAWNEQELRLAGPELPGRPWSMPVWGVATPLAPLQAIGPRGTRSPGGKVSGRRGLHIPHPGGSCCYKSTNSTPSRNCRPFPEI